MADAEKVCDETPKTEEGEVVDSGEWKTENYRSKVVERIEKEIVKTESQVPKSATDLEKFAFSKATSKQNYLDLIARVLIYVAEFNMKKSKSKDGQEETEEGEQKNGGKEEGEKDS